MLLLSWLALRRCGWVPLFIKFRNKASSIGAVNVTDFAYTGKKGTGKSKNMVRVIRDLYFKEKRLVATNLDLFLEPMLGVHSRQTYVRVPDKPSAFDLAAVGHGNPASYDEEKNGCLALDEMGTWFNTRSFSDKDRAGTLDFFAHARKFGFDCYYIMQNVAQVDKQLRESFIEFTVRHVRFDKVRIPFVGGVLSLLFGVRAGYFPRFHSASTRLGCNPQDLVTDSVRFIGKNVEVCYDTRQVFRDSYPHGTHSVLSPWHVAGRFLPAPKLPLIAAFLLWVRGKPVVRVSHPLTRPCSVELLILAHAKRLPVDAAVPYMNAARAAVARVSAMGVRSVP